MPGAAPQGASVPRTTAPATTGALPVAPGAADAQVVAPDSNAWKVSEIEAEQARCVRVLRGLDIVAKPIAPLKEHECGAPAPLELISVGKSPQVTFYPTVIVTCDMAAALHQWIGRDLQPVARKLLGGEIIRIETMSSYSCRTAYGRKNARLSEHGKANAVDIKSFLTTTGAGSEVLADWGPTGLEIAAQVAAAKKLEAEKAATAVQMHKTPSALAAKPPATAGVATGSVVLPNRVTTPTTRSEISIGTTPAGAQTGNPGGSIGLSIPNDGGKDLGLRQGTSTPLRLGGPKPDAAPFTPGARTDFLRAAHDAACRVFGTVLGPEANAAHRNHFHVDMAVRRLKGICE